METVLQNDALGNIAASNASTFSVFVIHQGYHLGV
jgi:hypothetical protein